MASIKLGPGRVIDMDFRSTMPLQPEPTFEEQVQGYIDEWQARLRIDDWHIGLKVEREKDPGYYAQTAWSNMYRTAMMTIRHPDLQPNKDESPAPQDLECTVVHELVHLRLFPFRQFTEGKMNDYAHEEIECAVDLLAQALVAAKRGVTRIV